MARPSRLWSELRELTVHFYLLVNFNSGDRGGEAALLFGSRVCAREPCEGGFFEGKFYTERY